MWTTRDSTKFAHVYQVGNEGKSRYNGFTFEVRRRMSHGPSVQASYTLSTDDVSGNSIYGFIPTNAVPANYGIRSNGGLCFCCRY